MKGNPDVIACLKELLRGELAAAGGESAERIGVGRRIGHGVAHAAVAAPVRGIAHPHHDFGRGADQGKILHLQEEQEGGRIDPAQRAV